MRRLRSVAGWQMRPERLPFVGRAQDHLSPKGKGDPNTLRQVFPGDQSAVRKALKNAMHFLRGLDIAGDDCGTAELVLAEVINNVVKHAYAERRVGIIELRLVLSHDKLRFEVIDEGLPMPDGDAPGGRQHDLDCDAEDLPEGGFGWFLIRELTHDLTYLRDGSRNRLRFAMQLGQTHLPN